MDGQLVQKSFTLNNTIFDCCVIKIDRKIWFKAHDIAVFLDYKNPDQAIRKNVPEEARKQWDELSPRLVDGALETTNWHPRLFL